MALINCGECGKTISSQATNCVHCGFPVSDEIRSKGERLDGNQEKVIAEYKYTMLDAGPMWLLIFVATSVIGIGVFFLVTWSIVMAPRPRLTVTDRSLIYRDMNSKRHLIKFHDIIDITAGGSLFQKLIGSGYLVIKREGLFKLPLFVNGLSRPKEIEKLISKYRN